MANNLAKYRGKHNLTQEQLGSLLGVSKAAISYIEKYKINFKMATKIAKVLNENVFDIMGTDVLKALPTNETDKNIIIEAIQNL